MIRRIVFLLPLCLLIAVTWAQAQSITERIQKQYESLSSFQTDFVQTLTNASTKQEDVRTGTIAFKQPRLIRWETVEPEVELLIVGPDKVWDYFPGEEAVYTYPVEEILSSKTMLRFISGEADLQEDFHVEEEGKEDKGLKLKLVPKNPEPALVLAYLWIDPETAMLQQILLVDFFGNGNQLTFADTEINVDLSDDLFTFSPPAGVEILEN